MPLDTRYQRGKWVPVWSADAHCVAHVIRQAQNIPSWPVSCKKSPSCAVHGTPQCLHSWLILGERGRGRARRLSLTHLPPPELQKHSARWTLSYSLVSSAKTLFPPPQDCKLTPHTHTHIKEVGAAVTADRNVWKLLFSPLLSLTVYIDVFPPHSLLPGGLMYTRREWSLSGSRALLLPALSCIPSPPFCPSHISSSHHQVNFYHWTIAVAHYEVYHFLEALKPCIYLDFITSSSSPSPFALRLD